MLALLLLATAALCTLLTYLLVGARGGLRILDKPNERSLHSRPVPRTGGIAVLTATAAAWTLATWWLGAAPPPASLLWGAGLVALISFADDVTPLSPRWRFAVHALAAALLVWGAGLPASGLAVSGTGVVLPYPVAVAGSLLLLVWMTNLYNFMDGMDGFAGGMTVLGFAALAALAALTGEADAAVWAASVAAAAAGFLAFNFPPARIFLGDAGSATLGFLTGGLILTLGVRGSVPLWAGLLAFAPFVLDATATLLRRIVRREAFWRPHRTHYYQRLVRAGWSHRRTVLVEYGLMALSGAAALALLRAGPGARWAVGLACLAVFVAGHVGVRRVERVGARREASRSGARG